MSYLRKYAKTKKETKNRQYGTRLTEDEGKEFEDYCKELNLNPSEAIRYLILEELERERKVSNQKQSLTNVNERYQEIPTANSNQPSETFEITKDNKSKKNDNIEKTSVKPKSKTKKVGKRTYLNQFKVDDCLPCPVCNKWIKTDHFSSRHAKSHEGLSSDQFLKKYEKEALEMVKLKREYPPSDRF